MEAIRNGRLETSAVGSFQTDSLPGILRRVELAHIDGASPSRMALTTVGMFAVLFDTAGRLAWYHDFTSYGKPASNAIKQANGHITAFLGSTPGWLPVEGYYVEITPEGSEVMQYHAPAGSYMDPHDLVLTGEGDEKKAHFFTYTIRIVDLSAIGGKANEPTAGHQLIRANASGTVEFVWNAWDHIGIDEWITDGGAIGSSTDYDHPNALSFDADGNYVISWRNLNQVMAVDPRTGDVVWRVGGAKDQYDIVGDPFGGFSKQHSVKMLANDDVLMFDNGPGHSPPESRAVEYRLDPQTKTAAMVWQYRHDPPLFASILGWTERFPDGGTWIAFSDLGRIVEVDSSGATRWEGELRNNGVVASAYRIVPVASLY